LAYMGGAENKGNEICKGFPAPEKKEELHYVLRTTRTTHRKKSWRPLLGENPSVRASRKGGKEKNFRK